MVKYQQEEIAPMNRDEQCLYWTKEAGKCAVCGKKTHAWLFVEYCCSHECRKVIESGGLEIREAIKLLIKKGISPEVYKAKYDALKNETELLVKEVSRVAF